MRSSTIILISALVLLIISAIVGNYLESSGILTREKLGQRGLLAVMVVYFVLFCVLVFSAVPVALRFFIAGQARIGNAGQPLIQWLHAHEAVIVYAVWAFFAAGLLTAVILLRDRITEFLR
jgi:ABC-type anion transport system duplicated permease subunit